MRSSLRSSPNSSQSSSRHSSLLSTSRHTRPPLAWLRVLVGAASLLATTALSPALLTSSALADGWPVAHGDTANANFVDRVSAPALSPLRIVDGLGSFADGTVPVVASSGKVFLANQQGKVMAFHPDGTKLWQVDLGTGWSVTSNPALSDFDVLFLLATRQYTDHRVEPAVERFDTELISVSEDGRVLFRTALPKNGQGVIPTAPLNFVRGPDGRQALVFPARYSYAGGNQATHLFVYDLVARSAPIADVTVTQKQVPMTGHYSAWFGHGFNVHVGPSDHPGDFERPFLKPAPGAAVPQGPGANNGGLDPSLVTINDTLGNLVRYRYTGEALVELERRGDGDAVSGPAVARNGVVLYARYKDITILQLDGTKQLRATDAASGALPAVRPDGRVLAPIKRGVSEAGAGRAVDSGSESGVAPVMTRNHLYLAGKLGLVTYRSDDLQEVARYPWVNGGRQQPAIGPNGEVYAVADNKLHVFAAGITGNEPAEVSSGVTGPLDNGIDAGAGTAGARVTKPVKTWNGAAPGSTGGQMLEPAAPATDAAPAPEPGMIFVPLSQ